MEIAGRLQQAGGLRFPITSPQGQKAAGPSRCTEAENSASLCGGRHHRRGLAYVSHTVGTMLAEMGEHQLTIRDYLRHSNLHVTNKYLQATAESKRSAQGKLVDAILPSGLLSASKAAPIQ